MSGGSAAGPSSPSAGGVVRNSALAFVDSQAAQAQGAVGMEDTSDDQGGQGEN